MKILYLHQHFATPKMPGITRSYEFAKRLVQAGHDVHLIAADQSFPPSNLKFRMTIEEGIKIYWLPIPYSNKMGFYTRVFAFLKYAFLSAKWGLKIKADIIYASSPPLTATLPAMFLSRRFNIPLVLEVRDLWPELPITFGALKNNLLIYLSRKLEKKAYQSCKHIVALSPGMKLGIIESGYPSEAITVIPNSCDHDLFQISSSEIETFRERYPFLKNKPFALYAGTLGEANGVAYLAYLAQSFMKRNHPLRFVIMGDGHGTLFVEAIAKRLGVLNQNFFMLPPLPKSDMPKAFGAATLILNTLVDKRPLWNSSPNKFFDALAAQRPVAINFDGWLANLLRKTNAGVVLDPKNYEKAADTLIERLSDKEWLSSASKAAGKLGNSEFSRDLLFDRLEVTLCTAAGIKSPKEQPASRKQQL